MVRRGRLASPTRFNPRTRVGCDEWSQTSQCRNHWFQSTHPRGVRLPVMRRRFQPHHVSIHAPAWGTTLRQTSGQRLDSCFNPRTRVGCDCGCWCGPTASSRFNPRTRVGCDTATTTKAAPDLDVSIHAPAWGATLSPSLNVTEQFQFQSTHPRGVRPARNWSSCAAIWFQSTHPRGVRRFVRSSQPCLILVSIHAPAWGATWRSGRWPRSTATVSIHAPAWGATCSRWLPGKKGQDCFNPRTRVGCDDGDSTLCKSF